MTEIIRKVHQKLDGKLSVEDIDKFFDVIAEGLQMVCKTIRMLILIDKKLYV